MVQVRVHAVPGSYDKSIIKFTIDCYQWWRFLRLHLGINNFLFERIAPQEDELRKCGSEDNHDVVTTFIIAVFDLLRYCHDSRRQNHVLPPPWTPLACRCTGYALMHPSQQVRWLCQMHEDKRVGMGKPMGPRSSALCNAVTLCRTTPVQRCRR